MKNIKRVIIIVLDSVGIGALPDAPHCGDENSFTLKHVAESVENFSLPNLSKMGLGHIALVPGIPKIEVSKAFYGKMVEKSSGKDTTTGHWELAGTVLKHPFPVYPKGFPREIIKRFEERIGKEILGNTPASGTEIIKELGQKHINTGKPIVYTSADSVFQVAAHESIIPPKELYNICLEAREILQGKHGVARVIARPFIGEYPNFTRTAKRKDFSLAPPPGNVLNLAVECGLKVKAVGKIHDIFAGSGISTSMPTKNNNDGIQKTINEIKKPFKGILFTNLIDFDMLYGHRNDPEGYYKALKEFDNTLPEITAHLKPEDCLMITADHGCDPVHPGTDHTREYVPIMVYSKSFKSSGDLGTRRSFADLGQTTAELLQIGKTKDGESFAHLLC